MSSKIGTQTEHWFGGQDMVDWFAQTQPVIAKSIEDAPDKIRACKDVSPDTFWIGRAYTEDQDMTDPLQAAVRQRDRILSKGMVRDVDAWEGWNEVTGGHGWNDETQRYLEADTHLCYLLHAEELKHVAGSWSVGCPSDLGVWRWHYMLTLMEETDYLGLHEYCAPTMWDIRGFSPPYSDKEAYLTSGWFTLRYRQVWDILESEIDYPPPIIITECGIDSGAAHWPVRVPPKHGWKSFTDIDNYIQQLAWYDRQLQMDDYVLGATIFTFGSASPHWPTFDMWSPVEARVALSGHIQSQAGDNGNGGNGDDDDWETWTVQLKRNNGEFIIKAKLQ